MLRAAYNEYNGYDLRYRGKKMSPDDVNDYSVNTTLTGLAKLEDDFNNLGALAIRLNNGQRQRTALLGAMCRENYLESPVEVAGFGGNMPGIFTPEEHASPTRILTRKLEEIAHYTMGRGKVLNEYSQPVKHHNSADIRGEQRMWDVMHAVLWRLGIAMPYQLSQQGFHYVCCPCDMSEAEFEKVTSEICACTFAVKPEGKDCVVTTASGKCLQTRKIQDIKISIDAGHKKTPQKNGIVITADGVDTPLGWLVYYSEQHGVKFLPREDLEDLLKIINLGRGGFHDLSREQKDLITTGLLQNNGFTLFTQNRTFNTVYAIANCLEKEFNFDALPLFGKGLESSHKRMHDLSATTEIIEDFLTGIILTEMVQPLKEMLQTGNRPKLPIQFNDSFAVIRNITKATAYAYNLKKKDGSPVIVMDETKPDYCEVPELPLDVCINGELAKPDLINPKHAAAILATAILVSEQVILERLLNDKKISVQTLGEMLSISETDAEQLKVLAKLVECNEHGPMLGVQYAASEEVLACIRSFSHHAALLDLCTQLFNAANHDDVEIHQHHIDALQYFYNFGVTMQSMDGVSTAHHGARGINAGLEIVMKRLMPAHEPKLVTIHQQRDEILSAQVMQRVGHDVTAASKSVMDRDGNPSTCPFLNGGNYKPEYPGHVVVQENLTAMPERTNWCSLFSKALPIVVGAGAFAALITLNL